MAGLSIHSLKRALKRALIHGGLEASATLESFGAVSSARGNGAIFTLHHIRPPEPKTASPNGHLEITPEFLDRALTQLSARGYRFVRLEELPQLLRDCSSRDRFAAFTCDDGYRNNAIHALPVFEKHQAPVTIFISAGFAERTASIWWETLDVLINRKDEIAFDFGHGVEKLPMRNTAEKLDAMDRLAAYVWNTPEEKAVAAIDLLARQHGIDPLSLTAELTMAPDELVKLARHPLVTLGAHTLTHPALARLDAADARWQMVASADWLEQHIGTRPQAIAYPYGNDAACGEREFTLAREAGFIVGVTTRPGTLTAASAATPTALPRISLNGYYQKERFVRALASGIPFRLQKRP